MKLIDPIAIKKQVKEGHLTFFVEKGRIYCKEPTCTVEVGKTDAIEVKQGEWIFKIEGSYNTRRAYCSVCGQRSGIGGIKENQMKPFCPNCGAKMKGGK